MNDTIYYYVTFRIKGKSKTLWKIITEHEVSRYRSSQEIEGFSVEREASNSEVNEMIREYNQ